MDMSSQGWNEGSLRVRSLAARARSGEAAMMVPTVVPRWRDWRWIAGGATALMLTAFTAMPEPDAQAAPRNASLLGAPSPSAAGAAVAQIEAAQSEAAFADLGHIRFDLRVEEGRAFSATLTRAGLRRTEAGTAALLIERALEMSPAAGTKIDVHLGGVEVDRQRPLVEMSLIAQGWRVAVTRKEGSEGFVVARTKLPPPKTGTMRLAGVAGDGLYWTLREAGVGPAATRDYLMAINSRLDVGTLEGIDRFDLVLEPAGERMALVYAGLDRRDGTHLELMRYDTAKKTLWVDTEGRDGRESTLGWPVSAPVSSSFGMRFHPILGITRMHSGIDFAASNGTPIQAAADGVVAGAGWAGGHGRRVTVRHEGGLSTSYSHMSRIAVADGTQVRRGDVIGYVGSSGLSTGAHLHYEVHMGGRAVDPRSVGGVRSRPISGGALEQIRARLAAYHKMPVTKA